MAAQLLDPCNLCAPVAREATREECLRAWVDLMETCEQFLLAGLRREIGPDGDLRAAYRRWYAEQMEEHHQMMLHLMENLSAAEAGMSPNSIMRVNATSL